MSTLDRYLIRQILPPFLLALGLFTFALAIMPTLESTRQLLAKGVPLTKLGILESAVNNFGTADAATLLAKMAALRVDVSRSLDNRTTTAEGLVDPSDRV